MTTTRRIHNPRSPDWPGHGPGAVERGRHRIRRERDDDERERGEQPDDPFHGVPQGAAKAVCAERRDADQTMRERDERAAVGHLPPPTPSPGRAGRNEQAVGQDWTLRDAPLPPRVPDGIGTIGGQRRYRVAFPVPVAAAIGSW